MTIRWLAAVVAVLGLIAADPALARHRTKAALRCVDNAKPFSFNFLLPGTPAPRPNGCSPAVHQYGYFVGQDPDPNIRFQLNRDPSTGYAGGMAR